MAAAIVAFGAVSALGEGQTAFDVGGPGERPRNVWATRAFEKPFARASACQAARADRPRALLDLGLSQIVTQLNEQDPAWRSRRLGVIIGTSSGGFAAVDAKTGKYLWHFEANQPWKASPMTYMVNGRQYVAIASGASILSFALPEK